MKRISKQQVLHLQNLIAAQSKFSLDENFLFVQIKVQNEVALDFFEKNLTAKISDLRIFLALKNANQITKKISKFSGVLEILMQLNLQKEIIKKDSFSTIDIFGNYEITEILFHLSN